MLIKIFSDYCTSEEAIQRILFSCFSEYMPFYGKDFIFSDDYTHAIILNKSMPNLSIPKENVIGLAQEPIPFLLLNEEFIRYAQKHIGKYYVSDKYNLPEPFIEGNSFIFYDRPIIDIYKPKLMSIMISQKMYAPGHIYRHELVKKILQTKLPIDIWGKGCYHYKDSRIKGTFKQFEPYQGYQYHISIENFKTNYYFSEKIIHPLLLGTIPIYLGCKNNPFSDQTIHLTGNIEKDIHLLVMICQNPTHYRRNVNMNKVEEHVNILKNMKSLFNPYK
jgi:hypothetical protein